MARGSYTCIKLECGNQQKTIQLENPVEYEDLAEQVCGLFDCHDFALHFQNANIPYPVSSKTDLEYALFINKELGRSQNLLTLLVNVASSEESDRAYSQDSNRPRITRAKSFPRSTVHPSSRNNWNGAHLVQRSCEGTPENELAYEARFIPEMDVLQISSGDSQTSAHSTSSSSQNLSQITDSPQDVQTSDFSSHMSTSSAYFPTNRHGLRASHSEAAFRTVESEGLFLRDDDEDHHHTLPPTVRLSSTVSTSHDDSDEDLDDDHLRALREPSSSKRMDFNQIADQVGLSIDTNFAAASTGQRASNGLSSSRSSKNSAANGASYLNGAETVQSKSSQRRRTTAQANHSGTSRPNAKNMSSSGRNRRQQETTGYDSSGVSSAGGGDGSCSPTVVESPLDLSNWVMGRVVGQGGFGTVKLYYNKFTAVERAVKEITMTEMTPSKIINSAQREVDLLSKYSHEKVVKFYGSAVLDQKIFIFMELMPGGSVRNQIEQYGFLTEQVCRKYLKQILQGLVYLHRNQVVHRDLKCANILRDTRGNVKVADFGCAKLFVDFLKLSGAVYSSTGSPYWMSPEIILSKPYNDKTDIWSLGCTVVEMITGEPPNCKLEGLQAIYQVVTNKSCRAQLPDNSSFPLIDLVQKCVAYNDEQRPSAANLLHHEFIVGH